MEVCLHFFSMLASYQVLAQLLYCKTESWHYSHFQATQSKPLFQVCSQRLHVYASTKVKLCKRRTPFNFKYVIITPHFFCKCNDSAACIVLGAATAQRSNPYPEIGLHGSIGNLTTNFIMVKCNIRNCFQQKHNMKKATLRLSMT